MVWMLTIFKDAPCIEDVTGKFKRVKSANQASKYCRVVGLVSVAFEINYRYAGLGAIPSPSFANNIIHTPLEAVMIMKGLSGRRGTIGVAEF